MLKALTYNIVRIFIFLRAFLRNCNKVYDCPVWLRIALCFSGNFYCCRQLNEFSSFNLFHVYGIQLTREFKSEM